MNDKWTSSCDLQYQVLLYTDRVFVEFAEIVTGKVTNGASVSAGVL